MNETEHEIVHVPWHKNQLVVFVSGSIVVALILVVVSMALYASSGAAQLDLSRPGYQSVQDKVDRTDTFQSFSANGPVNSDDLDEFEELYIDQTRTVKTTQVFSGSALGEKTRGIDAPAPLPAE